MYPHSRSWVALLYGAVDLNFPHLSCALLLNIDPLLLVNNWEKREKKTESKREIYFAIYQNCFVKPQLPNLMLAG